MIILCDETVKSCFSFIFREEKKKKEKFLTSFEKKFKVF